MDTIFRKADSKPGLTLISNMDNCEVSKYFSFILLRSSVIFSLFSRKRTAIADPHHADPDPTCHYNADPDPACHFDADPDPSFQITKAQKLEKVLK
jgi:hypothetical protein